MGTAGNRAQPQRTLCLHTTTGRACRHAQPCKKLHMCSILDSTVPLLGVSTKLWHARFLNQSVGPSHLFLLLPPLLLFSLLPSCIAQLVVELTRLEGSILMWLPPPPSNSLWLSFVGAPKVVCSSARTRQQKQPYRFGVMPCLTFTELLVYSNTHLALVAMGSYNNATLACYPGLQQPPLLR